MRGLGNGGTQTGRRFLTFLAAPRRPAAVRRRLLPAPRTCRAPGSLRPPAPDPGPRPAARAAPVPPAGPRKRPTLAGAGSRRASARNHMEARARAIGCGRASRGARRLRLVPEQQRLHGPGVHVTLCLIPPVTESCAAAPSAAAAAARGAPAPPPRFQVAAAGGAAGAASRAPRASAAPRVPGPPPAAGDAAASRLRLSRGSAAELPGLPPKVGARLWAGAGGAQVGAAPEPEPGRAGATQAPAPRCPGPGGGCGRELAATGDTGRSGRRAGPRRAPASGPWGADPSALGYSVASAAGAGPRAVGPREGRPCRLAPLPPALPPPVSLPLCLPFSLSPPSAQPEGRGHRGAAPRVSSRRWVFGVWPCWPRAQKVSPLTSPKTPPARSGPRRWAGRGREGRAPPRRGEEGGRAQVHPARRGPSPGRVPVKSASSLFGGVGTWERDFCRNPVQGLGEG